MLPALIVGVLTGWYLGMRAGIIAGIVTAAAMLVAQFVPGMTLIVYALVIAWSAAVYFLGSKISARTKGPGWLSAMTGQASGYVKNFFKRDERK